MKLLTTEKERKIKMEQLRPVSKLEKILFPIIVTVVVCLILPTTAPLVGMLMLGNLFRESGVVKQLTETASNALMYIVVIDVYKRQAFICILSRKNPWHTMWPMTESVIRKIK